VHLCCLSHYQSPTKSCRPGKQPAVKPAPTQLPSILLHSLGLQLGFPSQQPLLLEELVSLLVQIMSEYASQREEFKSCYLIGWHGALCNEMLRELGKKPCISCAAISCDIQLQEQELCQIAEGLNSALSRSCKNF